MKIGLISTDSYIYSHGVRAISAYLKSKGHKTLLLSMPLPYAINEDNQRKLNFSTDKYSKKAILQMLNLVKDSDVIGISSLAANTKKALQLIKALKKLNKPIIWGGIFATTFPEFCIKHADIVCIGEGELALEELLKKIELGKNYYKTKNFWFKKGNKIIKNPIRPLFADLDKLPNYDYSPRTNYVLEKNKTFKKLNQKHIGNWLYYHGIRGCPFSCKYCCNCHLKMLYKNKGIYIRKRSIKLVIQDLEQLKKQFPKLQWIWITDDDINMRTIEELKEFRELYRKKIKLPFRCYMTPVTITEEKLKLLLEAGLGQIEVGIQTASDRVNKEVYGRPITKQQTLKAINLLHKYLRYMRSPTSYQLIITNPYEKKEEVLETIKFVLKMPTPFHLAPFGIVFFPGSPLYNQAVKDGIIKKFEDSAYDLDYINLYEHTKIKSKNLYYNTLLYFMWGQNTKFIKGAIPKIIIKPLLSSKTTEFFNTHPQLLLKISKLRYLLVRSSVPSIKLKRSLNKAKGIIYNLVPKKVKEPVKSFLGLEGQKPVRFST
ncbi:MAG: B12-binding domain-containing radical SAM protein [archaeon]